MDAYNPEDQMTDVQQTSAKSVNPHKKRKANDDRLEHPTEHSTGEPSGAGKLSMEDHFRIDEAAKKADDGEGSVVRLTLSDGRIVEVGPNSDVVATALAGLMDRVRMAFQATYGDQTYLPSAGLETGEGAGASGMLPVTSFLDAATRSDKSAEDGSQEAGKCQNRNESTGE